jgi:NADP-dependent 3-hydroxy acid dehydrogenase YdfG/acyl carrier protein
LRDNGAGQVIITGRSANTNHQKDRVIYKQLDVACEEEVKAFGKWLKESPLPLKGIVHAAGTNSRCLLKDMTIDDMLQVGAPKINGIRYLSRHLPHDQLDFLVTYSSIAAIWGAAMLAHYAAANAYMDAFVLGLKAKGIPAATINWGPWKNSNMVLKDSTTTSLLEQSGVLTINADTVGRSYASLLSMRQDQQIYVQLNQSLFLQMMEIRGAQSLWETLHGMKQPQPVTASNTISLPNLMLITDDAERAGVIYRELVLLVKEVLAIPEEEEIDPNRSFSDMGMDSILLLKFVERINKRLGTVINSNTIFNYPAPGLLTTHLNELSAQPVTVIKPVKEKRRHSYTEDMSDVELLKMINKEIQKYL